MKNVRRWLAGVCVLVMVLLVACGPNQEEIQPGDQSDLTFTQELVSGEVCFDHERMTGCADEVVLDLDVVEGQAQEWSLLILTPGERLRVYGFGINNTREREVVGQFSWDDECIQGSLEDAKKENLNLSFSLNGQLGNPTVLVSFTLEGDRVVHQAPFVANNDELDPFFNSDNITADAGCSQ